jgi:hypothetical protein
MTVTSLYAQQYEPTTTWPYIYPDFTDGELQMTVGEPKPGKFNIHINQGTLHFIEAGLIKEANSSQVFSLKIGTDYYANVGGRMMKILAKSESGFVAKEVLIDYAALNETGGAYGSSSNSISTQAMSSFEGIGGTRTNMNHMELKNAKDEGDVLPRIEKMYLVFENNVIYAAKKDVMDIGGIDKKALTEFIKEKKIKWKDPQSLIYLVDYLAEKINK